MDLKDLIQFSREEVEYQKKRFAQNDNDFDKSVLAKTIKIGEEVGELNEQVLTYLGLQRQEKLDKFKFEELEDEFIDILITLLNLSVTLDVDFENALLRKMEVIKNRRVI